VYEQETSVHPCEQPTLNVIMLFSLIVGAFLLWLAGSGIGELAGTVAASAWLAFGVFLVTFGVKLMAWVLREHERWRRSTFKSN
jgi:amino acid transporter